jgi:hypothetical protein
MPSSRHECEFLLLKYVPDPVRNEFVHVGVILREMGRDGSPGPVASVKFTSDWRRVRCLDPDADVGMLEGLESELRGRFAAEAKDGAGGNRSLMHVLEDSFSNSVQVTRAKAYLAESVDAGVEELMRMYVETPKREKVSRLSGRAAIQLAMRTEFERAGVWDSMRKRIRAAEYTRVGDPLRIDVGYSVSGIVRMFQAVSLEGSAAAGAGIEMAKGLAYSMPALVAGVQRVEGAGLEFTAVVEPIRQGTGKGLPAVKETRQDELESEWEESYRFAVETMEEHRIRVVTTGDLGRMAETARREMAL